MSAAEEINLIFDELERCKPWIEAALEYSGGTHDFKDIADAVLTNQMQFWASDNACIITQIIQYPKKRHLHIFLVGGNLERILDYNESFKEFAKINKCDAVTNCGRRGWVKVLKDLGYKETGIALGMEIEQ